MDSRERASEAKPRLVTKAQIRLVLTDVFPTLCGLMDPFRPADRHDVLSAAEENALSLLREAIAGLRARRIPVDAAILDSTLCGLGASRSHEIGEAARDCFTFHGAHFSLLARSDGSDGVEVNFVRAPS
jgi:hypothetical protein